MSSAISTEEDQQLFIILCCDISITALLVYEYLITFDREYQLVWKCQFSAATLVFLLARYPTLLVNILILPTIYPLSKMSCSVLVWLGAALHFLFIFLSSVFSSLRVYLLSGRQWQVTSLTFILSLFPLGMGLFADVQEVVVIAPPPINCTTLGLISSELTNMSMWAFPSISYYSNASAHAIFPVAYVWRATTMTVDVLVLAVTVHQTYWERRGAAKATLRTPLHTLILRDGTIYFLALLTLNIADIILLYFGETFQSFSYISEFTDPITAIIMSRFMLNLREISAPVDSDEDTTQSSSTRSICFTTFVEPLGAPLDHGFSFSAMDPNYLDDEEADGAIGGENVLRSENEIVSGQANNRGLSEAESGPSA